MHLIQPWLLAASVAALPRNDQFASASLSSLFARDDFDAGDLSFIGKLLAIGDSYSAGIGAGDRLGSVDDWACSRYSEAYPNVVNSDTRLGDASKRKFQFLSCSGAVIDDIVEKQLPAASTGQDVVMLSAGGNDAELVNILNQCVYQWTVFNKFQEGVTAIAKLKGEKWAQKLDASVWARGCAGQLKVSQDIMNSAEFSKRLDNLISATKKKLDPKGILYYTGYAKFFAEDLSADCDKVSWSTWIYKAVNSFSPTAYLTTDHRKQMNDLVDLMNSKISDAVKRAGGQVEFVDYDQMVGDWGGRFCEKGVDESTKESNTRYQTMFYELDTLDMYGTTPWKRADKAPANGTFEGTVNVLASLTQASVPNVQLAHGNYVKRADIGVSDVHESYNLGKRDILEAPNFLPDGYGRVFHPQVTLHRLIAEYILWLLTTRNQETHGIETQPVIAEPPSSCPIVPDNGGLSYCKLNGPPPLQKGQMADGYKTAVQGFCKSFQPQVPLEYNTNSDGKAEKGGKFAFKFSPKRRGTPSKECNCQDTMTQLGLCFADDAPQLYNAGEIDNDCGAFAFDGGRASTSTVKCSGLKSKKYVARDTVADAIKNNFCPDAVKQGKPDKGTTEISRKYYDGTPEEVVIAIDFKYDIGVKPDQDSCVNYLLGKTIDDCGGPTMDSDDVGNWNGGGQYIDVGDKGNVTYSVSPQAQRPDPPSKPIGQCQQFNSDDKVPSTGETKIYFTVHGGGWADTDSGKELQEKLKSDGPGEPSGWSFKYDEKLASSGFEWTAQYYYGSDNPNTGFNENAVSKAGGSCSR